MSPSDWPGFRGLLRRWLTARLPDGDWSLEFVEALDAEVERRAGRGRGGWRLTAWYLGQVMSWKTHEFVRAVRAREREREGSMGGSGGVFTGLGLDLRHAWRAIGRDRWATLLIVATLGVGIGSVTAMHGLAERLFLSGPVHVADGHEIVHVHLSFAEPGGTRVSPWMPYATATAIQERSSTFQGLSLYRTFEELTELDRVRPGMVAATDGAYFELLGTVPEAGRFFGEESVREPAVSVLSHSTAVAAFGSPGEALGRAVRVGSTSRTVIGVAPPGFAGPGLDRIDIWIPRDREAAGSRNWWVAGRVPEARPVATAEAEAQTIHEQQDPGRFFQWAREGEIRVAGVHQDVTGQWSAERSVAALLLGVVGLVLLLAWANVLNLLLARMTRRRSEVVVRLALGVGRLRLMRLLLVESLLLSLGGGLMSLPVAHAESALVRGVLLPDVAWAGSALDLRLLAATVAAVVLSGAILGLLPARRAGREEIARGLSGARQGGRSGSRVQTGLATAQVTMAAALLLCAGLFVKSFWTMRVTDLGVDAEQLRVVTLRSLDPSASIHGDDPDAEYRRALEFLRSRGDGSRFALSVGLPFYSNFGMSIAVPGRDSIPELPGGGPFVTSVSGGYFETVGTEIVRGRPISDADVETNAPVVVVGEATAATLWPGGDGLGECLHLGTAESPCLTVVGVAEDVHRRGYREPSSLQLYVSMGMTDRFSGASLLVRPPRGGAAYESRLSAELTRWDPAIDFVEIRRLDSFLAAEIRPWRLGAVMVSMVAVLAVLIAVGGVFGVLTYLVATRRREIGVRIALGASGDSIRRLVLRMGLTAGSLGVALGFAGVLLGSRWLGPLLFETRVSDPLVLTGVGSGLILLSALACLVPARRAARVDPVTCLRAEA